MCVCIGGLAPAHVLCILCCVCMVSLVPVPKCILLILFQAAVFNQTEIVFALMDSGASLDYKNAQGNFLQFLGPLNMYILVEYLFGKGNY